MITHEKKLPELLAPAGSFEAVCAAIYSGCDAVYLGGKLFNARRNAANFEMDELRKAADLCRLFDVKLYLTMNTLVYDRELKSALKYATEVIEQISPDAVIVQDIGFGSVLHNMFPTLPLHASTQMRLHSTDGANLLKEIGITRIIVAREMKLQDLKAAVNSGQEIEMFLHGALCVSQSGGCLMSSMIGKRSGNRGECAQPCRLPCKTTMRYPLSLKDLCLAKHIPELIQAGISSFKIEGRMKSPDYVAGVVSVYRKLIDENRSARLDEIAYLDKLFSRQGFTDGYLMGSVGLSMFGFRTESSKIASKNIVKRKNYLALLESKLKTNSKVTKPKENYPKIEVSVPSPEYKKPLSYTVLRFVGSIPENINFPNDIKYVDIPIWRLDNIPRSFFKRAKIRALMPNVCTESDKPNIIKLLEKAKRSGISDVLVTNISQIPLCKSEGFQIHGESALNVTNEQTLMFYENKLNSIGLSPELNSKALMAMKKPLPCELFVYGKLQLMHTENCIIESISGKRCNRQKKNCSSTLIDRTGAAFPVKREYGHRNCIYNSVPLNLTDKQKELKRCGISGRIYLFTDEKQSAINTVLKNIRKCSTPPKPFTRGYF